MLSENYSQIAALVKEAREQSECLTSNVNAFLEADTEDWRNVCKHDVQTASEQLAATLEKISNLVQA
jgi:adenosyl cobinamide kinase/adenosyl cobinamide phosphate guanylyltransferase